MIRVQVPATSANCCIGFDCMGMALNWYATFTFEKSIKLEISGCPKEYQNQNNLVVLAFYHFCDVFNFSYPKFHLHVESNIPFARGLGSSATCILGGLCGANAWFGNCASQDEILKMATKMEGHPDNVAPALLGKVILCHMDLENIEVIQLDCAEWYGLAMIPDYSVSTEESRKTLPVSISHKKASQQVSNALFFVDALKEGDEKKLLKSSIDYLHEPYRKKLIPDYDCISSFCLKEEIPMWISGSGSTMLAVSMRKEKINNLKQFMQICGINCIDVKIAKKGVQIEYE